MCRGHVPCRSVKACAKKLSKKEVILLPMKVVVDLLVTSLIQFSITLFLPQGVILSDWLMKKMEKN